MKLRIPTKVLDIKRVFNHLRKEADYSSLGWIFWDAFLFLEKKTPARKIYSALWKSLSKKEKEMCENG